MRSVTLADGTDLAAWANRRDAQDTLPRLVRRLIHATVPRLQRIGFPAGEGVQLGGWDGIVVADEGNPFVPNGPSAWELGTNRDVKGKADADYEKRSLDPGGVDRTQASFVFVTPRRWGSKDDWVAERQREGRWREVRAYDADDLEAWLDAAPAVHVWLSIMLGKHPEAAMDLESFWADWSTATAPTITPRLVLAGRAAVVERVHQWLRESPPTALAVQAGSRDEALAVYAAVLQELAPEEQSVHFARALVVQDPATWQRLAVPGTALTLIPTFETRDAVQRALRHGHRVLLPLGPPDSASDTTLVVPPLSRKQASAALAEAGLPAARAEELAGLARRSLTSFRRRIAVHRELQQPEWARPAEGRAIVPALLAGAWNHSLEGDRQVLATLAQATYDEVATRYVRWTNEVDPPVLRVGDTWLVISKEDAWSLLARYLTADDLIRLEQVVLDVLGTPDPRFDLPEDQRWFARARGAGPRHSDHLRKSLADTLAVLGARGETTMIGGGASAGDWATRIVRQLLGRADTDWRVWASLADVLPRLAEAAPDAFLAAVDQGISGEAPVLLRLFAEHEDVLFSSSEHTGLLWALETVSWSREHLARAALLLARLATLDPGGRPANRPDNSLREIFLPWRPQTTASLDQRLAVLDTIRNREPEIAWRLLGQLLPQHSSVAGGTAQPHWREWAPESLPPVTNGEYRRCTGEIVGRMLNDVGMAGSRWKDLIEALHTLPMEQHEAVVDRLATLDVDALDAANRRSIADALRKLVSRHRSFPDSGWVLPPERIDRLEREYDRFESPEPRARCGWLFGETPELPEGLEHDYEARQEALARARRDALRAVYDQSGSAALLELAGQVQQPYTLGLTLGQTDLLEAEENQLLRDFLASDDRSSAQFASGFAVGRVSTRGRAWLDRKLTGVAAAWSPALRAELLVTVRGDLPAWDLVEGLDAETQCGYWVRLHPFGLDFNTPGTVERAARQFLRYGRPYAAVDLLASAGRREALPADLVAEALEAVLATPPPDPLGSGFSVHVTDLLEVLYAAEVVDQRRIARIEWGFLPMLGSGRRGWKPRRLHRELARDPRFFAEVLSLVYRAEGEEAREVSEEQRLRARRAYDLLESWRTPPGVADDGSIDEPALRNWVRQARETTVASGRLAVGDISIGHVLSGSPPGPDGAWPHPAIRDVIEMTESPELERGIEVGIYNSRGVVSRAVGAGGAQERTLAERYAGFAAVLQDRWPRTAAMLRRTAEGYRADAQREDQDAELDENLGW